MMSESSNVRTIVYLSSRLADLQKRIDDALYYVSHREEFVQRPEIGVLVGILEGK
jgi:hypothetical protein